MLNVYLTNTTTQIREFRKEKNKRTELNNNKKNKINKNNSTWNYKCFFFRHQRIKLVRK